MCEIFVFDPNRIDNHTALRTSAHLFEEQGHGLGIVAVYDNDSSFSYEVYKSTAPHWATVSQFFKRHRANGAWRFIVHGRYSTGGGINKPNCHPIEIEDEHSNIQWVVHNGSVRNHNKKRRSHISGGHRYSTLVDSEVIGHQITEIPDSMDDVDFHGYSLTGKLNYILLSEDGILVHNDRQKYHIGDNFTVTCRPKISWAGDNEIEWMIVTPGGNTISKETTKETRSNSLKNRWTNNNTSSGNNTLRVKMDEEFAERSNVYDSSTNLSVSFTNLLSNDSDYYAYRVIEGTILVVDQADGNVNTITEEDNPDTYWKIMDGNFPKGGDDGADYYDTDAGDLRGYVPPDPTIGATVPKEMIDAYNSVHPRIILAKETGTDKYIVAGWEDSDPDYVEPPHYEAGDTIPDEDVRDFLDTHPMGSVKPLSGTDESLIINAGAPDVTAARMR